MEIAWEDLSEPPAGPHWTEEHPAPVARLRCLCGRFARWVGDRHYYNGQFDCYSYTIACTRCGEVTMECV